MNCLISSLDEFWEKQNLNNEIPAFRDGSSLDVYKNQIYLFGGFNGESTNDFYVLNVNEFKWFKLDFPNAKEIKKNITVKFLYINFRLIKRLRNEF